MGWLFNDNPSQTKADYVREILARNCTGVYKVEKQAIVGNHLWTILAHPEHGKFIMLWLLQKRRGEGWGYKDMDESMAPYYYDCPLSFLDAVPPPEDKYGTGWRDKVRAYHAEKKAKRSVLAGLRAGCRVRIVPGCSVLGKPLTEVTITSTRPLRGTVNGMTVRLRPRLIAEVIA